MALDQFAQGHAHLFFDIAGLVHMAGDAEHLGAGIVGAADTREPFGAAAQDGGRHRDALDIVDRGGTAIEPDIGGEWRLQPRLALLAFQRFQQRCFLAANVSARAVMDIEIEIPAMDIVLANQVGGIGFVHRALQRLALADEFAPHIDVAGMRPHREAGDQAAFDQRMRVVAHDVAILAGARLAFVGVDDQIMWAFLHLFGHEGPFQTGRKSRAAAAAQARFFHFIDDGLGATIDDRLGTVPGAAFFGGVQARVLQAIEIGENAVAIGKHQVAAPGGFCAGVLASMSDLAGPRAWWPTIEPS